MKIVVGLSGGVDSAVAAYLLKKEGHHVVGVFMRNWNDASFTLEAECPWVEDSTDALLVAEKLDIPFHVVDLSTQYKERIVDYMFHEYAAGRTPNPDVLCNREVKFDIFLKIALELGADAVATGHYCRKEAWESNGNIYYKLLAGKDKLKDQSYFLCQLNQEQLSYALFPIGEMEKPQVRELAKEIKLSVSDKKDSQGLCFIGKVSLPDFLQQQLEPKTGDIIEVPTSNILYDVYEKNIYDTMDFANLEAHSQKAIHEPQMGKVVGQHNGAHFFTKGQRKRLGVGGKKEPLFVIDTDVKNNIVYVGQGSHHKGLYRNILFMAKNETHWLRPDLSPPILTPMKVMARIRYRQALQEAIFISDKERNYLIFKEKQFAIAEGQFAAWYIEDELVGSGVIG